MNYERNKKYFNSEGIKKNATWEDLKIPVIVLGVGVVVLFIPFLTLIGIIIAIIGGFMLKSKLGKQEFVTDEEIDRVYREEVSNAIKKGLEKLGLDEDEAKTINPIVISGTYNKKIAKEVMFKKGKDERVRSSNYEVAVLFFSDSQVYSYTYRFSITENEKNEETDEYFYKDIVSISTSSTTETVRDSVTGNEDTFNLEYFRLTTSGGTSIQCAIWDLGAVERSIQGMKQLLREKKSA